MKRLRLATTALCALLLLSLPVMADDFDMGSFNSNTAGDVPLTDNANESPSNLPNEAEANHGEISAGTTNAETEGSADTNGDDDIWGAWNGSVSEIPNRELPSQEQQKLEQKQQELEQKQQQREETFQNTAPETEKPTKNPSGSTDEEAAEAPTELVLPQREVETTSPVRYILIGALFAAALCIAIYLFTHPAREEDDPSPDQNDD